MFLSVFGLTDRSLIFLFVVPSITDTVLSPRLDTYILFVKGLIMVSTGCCPTFIVEFILLVFPSITEIELER